jgi:beta-glucosidase
MTFHRGASLTTATTLGYADTADLGPTAGNGFYRQWPDDLALLQDLGLTDLRISLDWARLQQKPGDLDADWVERFENILEAADAIGLRTWATLSDGSIPRWFDNEGGFADADAFVEWWPRWVERAADRFGDHVHGWVPFDVLPADASQPWRDTWGILGGSHPVVASIEGIDGFGHIGTYVGRMDRLGLTLPPEWAPSDTLTDALLEQAADRWGTIVRVAADESDGAPVVITGFRPGHDDHDECARILEVLVSTLDLAIDDGVSVEVAFVEPAIAGHDSAHGLLDSARAVTATAEVYLA